MNNAFLRSEKELTSKNKTYQAMAHNGKVLCKDSSCQNDSIQFQPKKMSDKKYILFNFFFRIFKYSVLTQINIK